MTRLVKQILFGSLFLAILLLVAAGLYTVFLPQQSCTNGRHDWGEQGLDCGGRCSNACIPSTLRQVTVTDPQFFRQGDTIAVLLRFTNPNSSYAAGLFRYRLEFRAEDKVVRTREVETFLYPDEVRYEAQIVDVPDGSAITDVRAASLGTNWTAADRFSRPDLSIQDRQTEITGSSVRATGRVVNHEAVDLTDASVIALFYGKFGLAGVSKTELGTLRGNGTENFAIVHPLVQDLDPQRTEFYVSAKRPTR